MQEGKKSKNKTQTLNNKFIKSEKQGNNYNNKDIQSNNVEFAKDFDFKEGDSCEI